MLYLVNFRSPQKIYDKLYNHTCFKLYRVPPVLALGFAMTRSKCATNLKLYSYIEILFNNKTYIIQFHAIKIKIYMCPSFQTNFHFATELKDFFRIFINYIFICVNTATLIIIII